MTTKFDFVPLLALWIFCGALVLFAVPFVIGRPDPFPAPIVDFKRLDELQMRLKALESGRCMQVTTPSISITVYPTPHLGAAKVPPPAKETEP